MITNNAGLASGNEEIGCRHCNEGRMPAALLENGCAQLDGGMAGQHAYAGYFKAGARTKLSSSPRRRLNAASIVVTLYWVAMPLLVKVAHNCFTQKNSV